MLERLSPILAPHRGERGALIYYSTRGSRGIGHLPQGAISEIAQFLGLSEGEVYRAASFYAQFRFERRGKHTIKICEGTTCHVRGSQLILAAVERELDIQTGEATEDYKFTLERVACVGCCALALVMIVDNIVYSEMTMAKALKILAEY